MSIFRRKCPLYPQKRTSGLSRVMSALYQKRTYAPLDALYSITTFADASRPGGTLIPNALAVDRLMASSNSVGCTTGMSAGFSPFENPAGIDADLVVASKVARSITHESTDFGKFA